MQLTTALAMANGYAPNTDELGQLSDILCPDFINQCLEATGVATVRKRRIPLDMAVWTVIAMSLYRQEPVWSIVSKAQLTARQKAFSCSERCGSGSPTVGG